MNPYPIRAALVAASLCAPWAWAAQPAGVNIGSVLPPEAAGSAAVEVAAAKASDAKASAARPSAMAPQGDLGAATRPTPSSKRERSGTGR